MGGKFNPSCAKIFCAKNLIEFLYAILVIVTHHSIYSVAIFRFYYSIQIFERINTWTCDIFIRQPQCIKLYNVSYSQMECAKSQG